MVKFSGFNTISPPLTYVGPLSPPQIAYPKGNPCLMISLLVLEETHNGK